MLMMISSLIYLLFVLFLNEDTQATNVRLVGGNHTEGRLEVYWNGTWSNACYYSYFNNDERGPSVVCRMLGISWSGYFNMNYRHGNKPVNIRDIRCQTGLETDIDQCKPYDKCNGNCCTHVYDIGVSCYDDQKPLRLNGKNSDSEGIVQVYLPTDMPYWEWVPLCADGFDDQDAKVICRSLNFSTSGSSASSSQMSSSDQTLNEYFNCQGSEKHLLQCTKDSRKTCPSKQVAVVSCDHTEVKLTNGNSSYEGRLEVKHNGLWGNVCAAGFDENDAKVVCRMLGFETRQVELMNYQQSDHVQGQVHLSNVVCDGNEKDIKACANVQWNIQCSQNEFVEIGCYATEIRLVNGKSPFEGRVEVKYNGTWGTVCDDGFSIHDSKVVCRMLGIESKNPIKWNSAHFGQGKGRILMDNVVCLGNETDIATCKFNGWGHNDCSHSEDASVQCISDVKINLINSITHSAWEGRLEVIIDGKHGTVNGRHFTQNMADRFCKYLGYNESDGFTYNSKFGRGSSNLPVWNLQPIFGYAGHPFRENPVIKNHYRDVGIVCGHTLLRLVGGSSYNAGRVELQHKGLWGAICCDGFTRTSGDVICKQLRFIGLSSWSRTSYGRTAGKPMWIKNLSCDGNENDIAACNSDDWNIQSCSESCNVGVICEHNKVRLVNGSALFQGRVEFYHNSEWGSIRIANDKLAHTVCRMLGYNESDVTEVSILSADRVFGESTLELLTQSYCSEQLFDIERCISDTGVNWTRSTGTHPSTSVRCKMNIRLSNGPSPSAGRVEIMRNNVWGTLCSSGMTENLATEVCKMVAAYPLTWHTTGKLMKNGYYGKGSGPVWKIRDGCHHDIAKCLLPASDHIDCNHSDDVGVYCLTNINTRLSGGSNENEGRVELQYNNEWIGVCDTYWNANDASAICHSLGYWSTSATARKDSWFGQSTNQLWYTYRYCISNDIDVGLCQAHPIFYYGRYHCSHTHEAGVSCVSTNTDRHSVKLRNGPGAWKGELIINLSGNLYGGICWQLWNTNTNDVVCRTLGYRLQGQRFTSYKAEKTIYPLYLSELNCTGHEVNIGMCKGYYDVYNCTTDAVGIDCSGGIQVRLQNGTNPFEGRVEIFLGGVWNTLCDSSWNNYDAKAICSTLGIGTSTPVLLSNAHYGQGNTSRVIGDLGCAGWEDHIGQCNIIERGSCLHTKDAGVRCVDCYEEITTQSGQITSNNYPSYFSDKKDCIFVIKPAKIMSSNVQYVLSIEDLRSQSNRDIEIKEGIHGSVLKHVTYYQPTDTLVGKEFFIRYTKTNTQTDRYKITWKLLERRDAIKIGCGPASWDIAVNMTIMKKLYPDTIPELIYFPDAGCKGVWRDDTIFFSQKYTECRTQREDRVSSVLYKNRLMYPEANTPNPVVIRNFRWTIDVDCELSKINSATVNFHPNEILSTTVSSHSGHENVDHISGSGKEGVIIAFYKDQHFLQQINGNPLQIHIGENIYVKVKTHTTDNNYKMRLHSCVAKPQSYSSATYAYPLIQDGCPTDSTTKIISQTTHETTFVFSSFEFQTNKDNVFVECNATFCLTGDNSVACQQACHTKRSVARIPDTSFIEIGYSRPFRVLYVEDSSNHSHDVKHNMDQQKGSKQNILDEEESLISKI